MLANAISRCGVAAHLMADLVSFDFGETEPPGTVVTAAGRHSAGIDRRY
ncbi:hypothetical protein [Synechococcus sp. MIT S9503]